MNSQMHRTSEKVVYKNIVGKPDYSLVVFLGLLSLFGLAMLLSASSYESEKTTKYPQTFFLQQGSAFIIAGFVMFIMSFIDYRWLRKLGWLLSFFALASLLMVDFSPFGVTAGGSQRWLNLGPLSFQPSEIVKVSCLILMADGLANNSWKSWEVGKRLLLCLFMAGLILKEPDLGTAVLIVSSCGCLLVAAGLNLFIALGTAGVGLGVVITSIMHNPYQLQRFQAWLAPEKDPLNSGYNLLQAYYAIGSGGLLGVGYGGSIQKLGYLPVSYADFIFAIICEELGLVGTLVVIFSFAYILWKGVSIAFRVPGNFGKLLGLGIIFSLTIQAIFNLGGVVGLLPVTGMPLPLISYGKTSIVMVGFMLGILLNLSRHKKLAIKLSPEEYNHLTLMQTARQREASLVH